MGANVGAMAPAAATGSPPSSSPLRLAETLRGLDVAAAADRIARLDPRFARLTLCVLHRLIREDYGAAPGARDHDEALRLLLQLRVGVLDWVLRTGEGGRATFAVEAPVQDAVDRVAVARLEELRASSPSLAAPGAAGETAASVPRQGEDHVC